MSFVFPREWSEWLDRQIWPQIHSMMFNDAYFRLMGHARGLTGSFDGPIGRLIEIGYVTSQTIAIRRLCDQRGDVISLWRLLTAATSDTRIREAEKKLIHELSSELDQCNYVCRLVNTHIAHTAKNASEWNLQMRHLDTARTAICRVAIGFERDVLRRRSFDRCIPDSQQGDVMQDFRPWVAEDLIPKLWEFWHAHRKQHRVEIRE